MFQNDTLRNVLYIDLTNKSYSVRSRQELFEQYIGGSGVAIQLLLEECPPDAPPLGASNPIIFAVGPLNGFYPLASKTVAMFKSPHTKNLGESHCGGRSSIALRLAGLGAVVIKGKSPKPIYIAIHGPKVYFKDADALWGMESSFTAGRILRENEPGAGLRTIMRIGRAGENLVTYAGVTTETYRHFGRLGLGAVFGSKNLKALVISGKGSLPVKEKKQYRKLYKQIYDDSVKSELMKKYHDLGTPENVMPLNKIGGLPIKNLNRTSSGQAYSLSGENFAQNYLGRRLACSHCPVGCIHIAALREPYEDEPYFYKTSMISYDYEPIYAIGFMLGGNSPEGYLKLMDKIEAWGLDVMSTGVVLAWATEAYQKGIISSKETGGIQLKWNDYPSYMQATRKIVERSNDFYHCLGQGVHAAASKYGGSDFALTYGGNEMPGYHTGPASHIGYLAGARHSHLDNAGYSIDQKELAKNDLTPAQLGDKILEEERWRQILSSLVVCFFARAIYKPALVSETLRTLGYCLEQENLFQVGKKIHSEKYRFKKQCGFSLDKLSFPERIFQTDTPAGKLDKNYMKETINHIWEKI